MSSDIYYIIDNIYYDDITMTLYLYTLSKQKEILGLLKNVVF